MSIEVRSATTIDDAQWNDYVDRSPCADLFHRSETLDVLGQYTDSTVHRLAGFKGEEPVGVFPVFEVRKGPVTTAFSPPPEVRVPYLGPAILNVAKLKQRKAERRHQAFIEGCLDWLDDRLQPRYVHLRLASTYPDLRPLKWADFEATPRYTYHVDLTPGRDGVLQSFSRDARSNVRDGRDDDSVRVREGGRDAVGRILEQVRRRYESQGIAFHLDTELVTDLYDRLPDGAIRPYVCRVDGSFVGGILTYEHGDSVYRWQGGVKTDADIDVPVNDLLDWQVIADAIERDRETYDLVGANDQRINGYKAKFNPEVREYYSLERSSPIVNAAAHLYNRIRSAQGITLGK